MSDFVADLLAAIEQTERDAPTIHSEGCDSLPPPEGYNGPFPCDCGVPAAVLRRCKADFRTWARHKPYPHRPSTCTHDSHRWPCLDFRDLADRYGISVEEETTQ